MLLLPEDRRHLFRTPFGTLYPDIDEVIPLIRDTTVYTVGDVVTCHLIQKGVVPAIAVIDGHTMRIPCNRSPAVYSRRRSAWNPPGTLTDDLIKALECAVADPGVLIFVEGEEDLAVIPLVLAAPDGAVVLYGQPGEGVVLCRVTAAAKEQARTLLSYFVEQTPGAG